MVDGRGGGALGAMVGCPSESSGASWQGKPWLRLSAPGDRCCWMPRPTAPPLPSAGGCLSDAPGPPKAVPVSHFPAGD